ncbi:unnamed protein product [Mytilus coruscus]|uniref:Uncharacterized protein n=1 Tax=Mytilus coruscus TaxID=42192 RepID=A0A6J8D3P0_MYTCO|nr:unnamed protein product [Mytilus coruscus]
MYVIFVDIDDENNIESDDCNITSTETTSQRPSKESYMSSTEYLTTVTTDYLSTSTSSLPDYQTILTSYSTKAQSALTSYSTEDQTPSTSYSTENQTTPNSYSTENQTASTSFSTENQTSSTSYSTENQTTPTSYSTENKTTPTSYSTENHTTPTSYSTENQTASTSYSTESQTISTSYSTENDKVTTFTNSSSENKQSEQLPTVVVGSVIGVVVIILIVVAVLVVVRRKKFLSNKYRKHDKAEETEKQAVNETKRSPLPVGSSNVSCSKSDVYCDPWQSFEESQTLTKAGKKLNRQSQNPMYELSSFQYDSYSVAGGLIKQNHTEKHENVNPDIYNHCNLGNSTMDVSQQNVYDSAAGIYSHLNHGDIKDHNEDTYDHFHGSDQDYDQFDRTLRKTEDTSEYSLYQ